jgi:outer membrane protein assembly factor BamB
MHIKGAPAIGSDGTVYCIVYDVTGQTSHLYALNSGGTLKWKYEDLSLTDPGGFGEWTAAISPEATQDVIFAPSRGGGLYAINSADGSLRWRYAYGGYITTPVIGLSNTIYFNADGGPSAINPDGTLKWRYISTGYGYSPPSLGSQETVYFGLGGDQADTAYVYALNSSGSLEWKCSTAGLTVFASPAVGSDGTIYIGTTAKGSSAVAGQCGVFYAIDASGVKKWSYDTSSDHTVLNPNAQSDIYSSATIGADGTIYFSTEGRYLYALNPDGTVKIKYDMYALSPISSGGSAIVYSSPAIAADGTIYVGDYYHFLDTTSNTAEGAVYALRSDSLGIDNTAIWPKFHGNNKNTGKKD